MTMATYYVSNPGNTVLQAECWTLSTDEARQWLQAFKPGKGTYYEGLAKAYRRARRTQEDICTFITGGFTTGEFANQLRALDIAVSARQTYR
jgi:hypothetical protein